MINRGVSGPGVIKLRSSSSVRLPVCRKLIDIAVAGSSNELNSGSLWPDVSPTDIQCQYIIDEILLQFKTMR